MLFPRREGGGEGGSRRLGLVDVTIIYRMGKQQGSTVYTEDYIQYPMINHNGKEFKKRMFISV